MSDDKRDAQGHYHGKVGSYGEHRTVGDHRAWCHDCGEWCYPGAPCGEPKCCTALDDNATDAATPSSQAEQAVARVRALADDLEEGAGGDRTIEWAVGRIRAALDGTS